MKSVALHKIAESLDMDPRNLRRYALDHGFEFHKKLDPVKSRVVLCLSEEEAGRLIKYRKDASL